jgi:high-affinity iron transporter
MFAVTNTLIQLLAAAIASQLARALAQAGLLNAWGQPLWDSSGMLRMDSALGTLAHALVGYEAQPTGMQLTFYVLTLAAIVQGSRWVRQTQAARRTGGPLQRAPSS